MFQHNTSFFPFQPIQLFLEMQFNCQISPNVKLPELLQYILCSLHDVEHHFVTEIMLNDANCPFIGIKYPIIIIIIDVVLFDLLNDATLIPY